MYILHKNVTSQDIPDLCVVVEDEPQLLVVMGEVYPIEDALVMYIIY